MVNKSKSIYTAPITIEGYWEIEGVCANGESRNYHVFEKMTSAMNHNRLIEYSMSEKEKGNPFVEDSIWTWAIFSRAYELRNKHPEDIERLRKNLQLCLKQYPNTLTRAVYNPEGVIDKAVHNYGTPDEYILNGNLVGKDNWVNKIEDKEVLTSIIGEENTDKLNQVSQWLNNTDAYLWRLNSKPSQQDERVVGFSALSGGLIFGCYWYPADRYPAFRVLRID